MKEEAELLLVDFCDHMEMMSTLGCAELWKPIEADLQIHGEKGKVKYIKKVKKEIISNLETSDNDIKIALSLKRVESDLVEGLRIIFINSLHYDELFNDNSRLRAWGIPIPVRPASFAHTAYLKVDYSLLDEFRPVVQHLEWMKLLLNLNRMEKELKEGKMVDGATKNSFHLPTMIGNRKTANSLNNSASSARQNNPAAPSYPALIGSTARLNYNGLVNEFMAAGIELPATLSAAKGDPKKEFHPGKAVAPKTTIDFLIGEESEKLNLLEYLKKSYAGEKGKTIAIMIMALEENRLIAYTKNTELYAALRIDFGYIGSNTILNRILAIDIKNDHKLFKSISQNSERLRKYMDSLRKIVV